jgi:hypothetical protein
MKQRISVKQDLYSKKKEREEKELLKEIAKAKTEQGMRELRIKLKRV